LNDAKDTYGTALTAATLAQIQTGTPLVDVITNAFKEITALSDNLRKETAKINNFNAPKQGFKIAQGFTVIIAKVAAASAALAPGTNPSPLPDDAALLVVNSLTTFVQVSHHYPKLAFFTCPSNNADMSCYVYMCS